MLYPIGGLIADLRYGRYRIIVLSILLIWCGFLCSAIYGVIYAVNRNCYDSNCFANYHDLHYWLLWIQVEFSSVQTLTS